MKLFIAENIDFIKNNYSRIYEFADYSVFQSEYFYRLYKENNKTEPKLIICAENDVIKGFMLIQFQNYFSRFLDTFAKRAVIIGAPVFNGDEIVLSKLLEYYKNSFKKEVVYSQVRNIYCIDKYIETFKNFGFKHTGHLNYLIDLNENIDTIWQNVHSKRKNEIRKGLKENITVSEINYEKESYPSYCLLKSVYSKAGLPLPDYSYFKSAGDIMTKDNVLKILGGYYNGILVSVIYLLCYKGRVYNWYAAGNHEYYRKYPNDVTMWEAVKWAKENGYDTFDFGGAGNPEKKYGVRDFKKKFGGKEVNFGRFELIHKPIMMKISGYGFKAWQKLKLFRN